MSVKALYIFITLKVDILAAELAAKRFTRVARRWPILLAVSSYENIQLTLDLGQ